MPSVDPSHDPDSGALTSASTSTINHEVETKTCPECGIENRLDPRYVQWCPTCEWNADPNAAGRPDGDAGRAERHGAQLFERLRAQVEEEPSVRAADLTTASVGTSLLLATALGVWVFWVGLLGAAVWAIVVLWPNIGGVILAVPLVGIAYFLRPRLGGAGSGAIQISRSSAPELYAHVDDISERMEAPKVDRIVLDGEFNAGICRDGLSREIVMTIGVPLWIVLPPRARTALIAHEVGHVVNGDPRRGLVVWGAAGMLENWYDLVRLGTTTGASPGRDRCRRAVGPGVRCALRPAVGAVHRILHQARP